MRKQGSVQNAYDYFIVRLLLDSVIVFLSWMLAYFLRFYVIVGGIGRPIEEFLWLGVIVVVIFITFLNGFKLYQNSQELSWQNELQSIVISSVLSIFTLVFLLYFFYDTRISRVSIAVFALIVTVLLIAERIILKNFHYRSWRKGKNIKKVLLVGYGANMEKFYTAIADGTRKGYRAIGQLKNGGHALKDLKQFEGDLFTVVAEQQPDVVVISYPLSEYEQERELVKQSYTVIQEVILIPNLPKSYIGLNITHFSQIPIANLNDVNYAFSQKLAKRLFDFIAALLITIVVSPIMLVVALLVKLTSPGPVFYKQKRVTENGRIFTMLKFRSMSADPALATVAWTTKDDPRVTKVGKFIRRTSLDELPQLFNILKGDMSLIGPRPERPELVEQFIHEIPGYQLRHKVKAGLSGWAQVNGLRGDTSLVERINYDLYYIRNWGLLFDIKIFFLTFISGFINKNAY